MSSFHEVQFPVDISYGASGGPQYSTDVVVTASGFEQRNINWNNARSVYNVAHAIKNQEQLDVLIAFFRSRKGRAYGFRFKDWTDFLAKNQIIAVADGIKTSFQLIKSYESGESHENRAVHKPVQNSVDIFVDNILQNNGVSINYTNGVVTFDNSPPLSSQISASFEFDVPVRFDTDRLATSIDDYKVYSWQNISLVEIKIEE